MSGGPGRLILGIESSCDETAAALVELDGRRVRASVVASQIEAHRAFGGVVPELAARQHILWIGPVIREAMHAAGADWADLAAIAVTHGPGLASSLLVGVNAARGLAFERGLPLIGVNHIEGHLLSNWLVDPADALPDGALAPAPRLPLLVLVVSGGHTDLILMRDIDAADYARLGRTRDDAAGEAFDKVARILGLGFPGGPAIQRAAERGDPRAHPFSVARALGDGRYDVSFSGLKTAALRAVERYLRPEADVPASVLWTSPLKPSEITLTAEQGARVPVADLAASFQASVVAQLVAAMRAAARDLPAAGLALCGGVAANAPLRAALAALAVELGREFHVPRFAYCTDNAAMIAAVGAWRLRAGAIDDETELDIAPNLRLAG